MSFINSDQVNPEILKNNINNIDVDRKYYYLVHIYVVLDKIRSKKLIDILLFEINIELNIPPNGIISINLPINILINIW